MVHLHIIQPRNYHRDGPCRRWTTTAASLRAYANIAAMASENALGPEPILKTGTECTYCPARHACPALKAATDVVCDEVQRAIPLDLPDSAAGNELSRLKRAETLLDARMSGLEAQVMAALNRGEHVPKWAIGWSEGRERWNKPHAEVAALGSLLGVAVEKPTLITPAQARKAGLPAEVVAQYSERPRGERKLIPDDGSKAREVFGGGK